MDVKIVSGFDHYSMHTTYTHVEVGHDIYLPIFNISYIIATPHEDSHGDSHIEFKAFIKREIF
jgi:hypothetical protein